MTVIRHVVPWTQYTVIRNVGNSADLHGGVVLVGFRPYLQDQLVSFSALTLLVWSYDL